MAKKTRSDKSQQGGHTTGKKNEMTPFPVVGIGSSAGGLEALEELMEHMPATTGMAFVVISHQQRGHISLLPELLGKCTQMPVMEATDETPLEPDHVYLGPPGGYLAVKGTTLQFRDGPVGEMPRLPIDFFLRSLADDQKERAICIILSGTGSDGSLGLKAIKGESGMAMVQSIDSARYSGMPASAIGTGLVDFVMAVADMPAKLVEYVDAIAHHGRRPIEAASVLSRIVDPMHEISMLIRNQTGHDFSSYKTTTMERRIARRMAVHNLRTPEDYVRMLHDTPHEIGILFKELLIGVTSFFRDPDAFKSIANNVLPVLLDSRSEREVFRVWVPGCASGEEAYTIAILLREYMRQSGKMIDCQIFGTDLDKSAVDVARLGAYPAGIAADMPPEILARYFIFADGNYRVGKEIREMLIFAPHNVIKDPPFTKLDLLMCRNLLIYLNPDLQKRLLPIFHYALKPSGVLVLGPSESISDSETIFATMDKKWKIFKRNASLSRYTLPAIPAQLVSGGTRRGETVDTILPSKTDNFTSPLEKLLLAHFAPPTVVINERGDIFFIHGRTGIFLEPPTGKPFLNIHAMARDELKTILANAIRQVVIHDHDTVRRSVRMKSNGGTIDVDIIVTFISEPEVFRGLMLVTFASALPHAEQEVPTVSTSEVASSTYEEELERELRYTRESLQTTVEELETANEELQSANEELQSTNEELQSTNEELQSTNEEMDTSKEETQSLNEELTIVNAELKSKVAELSRTNDDMQNLLNSMDIATIFLDNDLKIKRYSDRAKKLIKLIPTDVGRPVVDLVADLHYDRLASDADEVLTTLMSKEVEVQKKEGGPWYLMRMMPYRTSENVIEGVVITFVDISHSTDAQNTRRHTQDLLQDIFDTFSQPALVLDSGLRVIKANGSFCRKFTTNRLKTEGQLIYDVGGGEWDLPRLKELLEEIIPKRSTIEDFEVTATFPRVGLRVFRLNARRLQRAIGLPGIILLTMEDVSGTG